MKEKNETAKKEPVFSNLFAASVNFREAHRIQAFSSLYSIMRIVDELADAMVEQAAEEEEKIRVIRSEIESWEDLVNLCYSAHQETSRLDLSLLKAVSLFNIPEKLWKDFFESRSRIWDPGGFETMNDLIFYARGAAGIPLTVFLAVCCAERTGHGAYDAGPWERLSRWGNSLGSWSFIIHVMSLAQAFLTRNEKTDGLRPRNLFPLDILKAHDLTFEDIRKMAVEQQSDTRIRAAASEMLAAAESMGKEGLAAARDLCRNLPQNRAKALATPIVIYSEIANRIRDRNFAVFSETPLWIPSDRTELISRIEKSPDIASITALW